MPLAISMALAFSFEKLTNDNVLVKNQEALETSGCLTDICTSKTSTLTTGELKVAKLFVGDDEYNVVEPQINVQLKEFMASLITMNTSAYLETQDANLCFVPCGAPIEVALLTFLIDNGIAVQNNFVERERIFKLKMTAPFSSDRKRMTVAYKMKVNGEKIVRIVVKGAPEELILLCNVALTASNERVEFKGNEREG